MHTTVGRRRETGNDFEQAGARVLMAVAPIDTSSVAVAGDGGDASLRESNHAVERDSNPLGIGAVQLRTI